MDLKEIIYNNQKEKHKLENAIGHLTENFNNFVEIRGDELRKIYKDLKKTIEFKDCELIIVDDPHLNFSAIDLEKKHILEKPEFYLCPVNFTQSTIKRFATFSRKVYCNHQYDGVRKWFKDVTFQSD
jgi:hypothetical protein